MTLVKCQACGHRYNYEEEGCCPNCGAYNQPKHRNIVEADGTVMELENAQRRVPHSDGKVCYEKKVCFEEPVRHSDRVRKTVSRTPGRKSTGHTNNSPKAFAIIVAFFAILSSVTGFLGGLFSDSSDDEPWNYVSCEMGDTITISEGDISFLSYTVDGTMVQLTLETYVDVDVFEVGYIDFDGNYDYGDEWTMETVGDVSTVTFELWDVPMQIEDFEITVQDTVITVDALDWGNEVQLGEMFSPNGDLSICLSDFSQMDGEAFVTIFGLSGNEDDIYVAVAGDDGISYSPDAITAGDGVAIYHFTLDSVDTSVLYVDIGSENAFYYYSVK